MKKRASPPRTVSRKVYVGRLTRSLERLIVRLETERTGSEELDALIHYHLRIAHPVRGLAPKSASAWAKAAIEGKWAVPSYTRSLDIAKAVTPSGWSWALGHEHTVLGQKWRASCYEMPKVRPKKYVPRDRIECWGWTEETALCRAILTALLHLDAVPETWIN